MGHIPLESQGKIFEHSCVNGGRTGASLSLVSRGVHDASQLCRYYSIALKGLPSALKFTKLLSKHHDKRHGYFGCPYEKTCKHVRAAEIWHKINEVRREEAFFPHSTEHERRIRAADGYNSTSTSNMGLLNGSGVPKQYRAGGKALERQSKHNMHEPASYFGHRLSPPPVSRKATVKSGKAERERSQRGSSNSSASGTSRTTDRSTSLDFKAASQETWRPNVREFKNKQPHGSNRSRDSIKPHRDTNPYATLWLSFPDRFSICRCCPAVCDKFLLEPVRHPTRQLAMDLSEL